MIGSPFVVDAADRALSTASIAAIPSSVPMCGNAWRPQFHTRVDNRKPTVTRPRRILGERAMKRVNDRSVRAAMVWATSFWLVIRCSPLPALIWDAAQSWTGLPLGADRRHWASNIRPRPVIRRSRVRVGAMARHHDYARSRSARYSWTWLITNAPSPTAEATRLSDPRRTSPAAKTPRRLDAAVAAGSAPASRPVRMNPHSSRFTGRGSHSVRGAPRSRRTVLQFRGCSPRPSSYREPRCARDVGRRSQQQPRCCSES